MFAVSPGLTGFAIALAKIAATCVLFGILWCAGGWLFNKLCYFTGWVFSRGTRFWAQRSEGSIYVQEDLQERGKSFFMGVGLVAVAGVFVWLAWTDGFKGAKHDTAMFLVVLVQEDCKVVCSL